MHSLRRFVTVGATALAFACVFATDATATRTPSQIVDLSGAFRANMGIFADEGATDAQATAIDNALAVFETEQTTFKRSLIKNSRQIRFMDRQLNGNATYDGEMETLIGLYDLTVGTCALEASQAILNGRGSIVGKARKVARFTKRAERFSNFAKNTDKPNWKRVKKLAASVGASERIVKRANRGK